MKLGFEARFQSDMGRAGVNPHTAIRISKTRTDNRLTSREKLETTSYLKVGIAGFGVIGKRRKECIDRHPHLRVMAMCDRTFSGEGVFPDGIRYHQDYKRLLTEDLDVLFVCLTNDVAAEVTIAGLESGLHVFCEKPPGRNVQEIVQVISVERLHPDLKLMYGFNHRYHDSVKEGLRIWRSGELGNVINMRGLYGKGNLITVNEPMGRGGRGGGRENLLLY